MMCCIYRILAFACVASQSASIQMANVAPAVNGKVEYASISVSAAGVDTGKVKFEHRILRHARHRHHQKSSALQVAANARVDSATEHAPEEKPTSVDSLNDSKLFTSGLTKLRTMANRSKESPKKGSIVAGIIQLVIMISFAILYKSKVVDSIPVVQPLAANSRGKHFKAGLFECCASLNLCLHTLFCGPCRAAHNFHVTNIMSYWPVLCLVQFCPCFMPCISGFYLRQKLRKNVLGLDEASCLDCLTWCFCMPCAIGQEALEIDEQAELYVRCFFHLETPTGLPWRYVHHPSDRTPSSSPQEPFLDKQEPDVETSVVMENTDEPPSATQRLPEGSDGAREDPAGDTDVAAYEVAGHASSLHAQQDPADQVAVPADPTTESAAPTDQAAAPAETTEASLPHSEQEAPKGRDNAQETVAVDAGAVANEVAEPANQVAPTEETY